MQEYRILIVDDEEDLCEILRFNLEHEGYIVDVAYSGIQALEKITTQHNLVLLDVMMDGLSGFQTAEKIRKDRKMDLPIIFITAKSTENDIITGFNLGADDYISKPFSIKEVLARVNSVLKRASIVKKSDKEEGAEVYSIWGLLIDEQKKELRVDGLKVSLTKKELDLLSLFISSPNRVFSREELLKKVWPEDGCVLDRTVDVHIARIRKKIGKYASKLNSKSGYGYYLEYEKDEL